MLYGRNIVESLMVKEAKAFMAAVANGMRVTYIDPRASITACKATRYWQVRPNSDYALNLAIIHEVLKQEAYDKDFVERFVTGMDALREAVKDTTPEWQESHTGVPAARAARLRRGDRRRGAARDLPSGLDDGAPQAVVLRQPHGADPERADGQHRDPGRLRARQAARVLRPQEPEAADRRACPRSTEPRVDGAGTTTAVVGPGHRHAAPGCSPPWRRRSPTASAPTSPTATIRSPAMPDPEAMKRALDKLKLLVSIDVRYSETGWYSDVILPESTYLERANILAQMPGPVPVFVMRDQAIAPRFDSRPAWWIFREILRRMGIKEALDFETIEEIWNYQLEGTGVTVAEMRETGIVRLADAPTLTPRDELRFPTPVGQDRDRERAPEAGRAAQPAALRAQGGADGRPLHLLFGRPATLAHGQSLNNPLLNEIAPEQVLWIHPDRARPLGIARRRRGRGQRRRQLRRDGSRPR